MFLKLERKPKGTYMRLVESYRDKNGKPKHRTIQNIGRLDGYSQQSLQGLGNAFIKLSGSVPPGKHLPFVQELARFNYGFEWLAKALMKKIGLVDLVKKCQKKNKVSTIDFFNTLLLMIVERLRNPSSKRSNYFSQHQYFALSQKKIPLQHLYRTLDFLYEQTPNIKNCIQRSIKRWPKNKIDIIFYDVTTFYFDSQKCEEGNLRQKGFSKDGKAAKTQVVFGLLIDKNQAPLDYFLYKGNQYEGHTLINAIEALKKRYNIQKAAIVTDRGMMSKQNIEYIEGNTSYGYIMGEKLKTLPTSVQNQLIARANYISQLVLEDKAGQPFLLSYYTHMYKGKTLIGTYSEKRAKKDRKMREEKIQKAKAMLNHPSKLMRNESRLFLKKKGKSDFEIDEKKIEKSKKFDGFACVATNLKDMSVKQILGNYRELYKVEHSFRCFKSHLETRPMFHWTDKRIAAHICLCYICYSLIMALKLSLKKKRQKMSEENIRNALSMMQVSLVKQGSETFYMASSLSEDAKKVLKAVNLAPMPIFIGTNQLKIQQENM